MEYDYDDSYGECEYGFCDGSGCDHCDPTPADVFDEQEG